MNSAKYIEIFKNGQKEGIRDVTVKRKLQTVIKFLSYLEDAQTDDLQNIDRKNVYEFVNSLDYRSQTISGVQFTLRQFFNIMYEQRLSSFDGYQLFPMITTDKEILSYPTIRQKRLKFWSKVLTLQKNVASGTNA